MFLGVDGFLNNMGIGLKDESLRPEIQQRLSLCRLSIETSKVCGPYFTYCLKLSPSLIQGLDVFFENIEKCSSPDEMLTVCYYLRNKRSFSKINSFTTLLSLSKKFKKIENLKGKEGWSHSSSNLNLEKNFPFLKNLKDKKILNKEIVVPQKGRDLIFTGQCLGTCTGGEVHFWHIRDKNQFRVTLFENGKVIATVCFIPKYKCYYALTFKHADLFNETMAKENYKVKNQRIKFHAKLSKFCPELLDFKFLSYYGVRDHIDMTRIYK